MHSIIIEYKQHSRDMICAFTGRKRFAFNLFSICVVMLCARLGVWQLHRAQEKTEILEARARLSEQVFHERELNFKQDLLNQYKTVRLTGSFINDKPIYIDNQMYQHRPGYDVLMPFRTVGQHILWVNRGWIAASLDRSILPKIPVVEGTHTIDALMLVPKKKAYRIGDVQDPQLKNRLQVLDLPALNQFFESSLANSVMILRENNPGSLAYHYVSVVVPPERHKGYAVQWFGLAFIWMVFSLYANRKAF